MYLPLFVEDPLARRLHARPEVLAMPWSFHDLDRERIAPRTGGTPTREIPAPRCPPADAPPTNAAVSHALSVNAPASLAPVLPAYRREVDVRLTGGVPKSLRAHETLPPPGSTRRRSS